MTELNLTALESTNSDIDTRMCKSLYQGCNQSFARRLNIPFSSKEILDPKIAYFEAHIMLQILCEAGV